MSAGTLKYVNAHVPVDMFEIVNGPSAAKCLEIQASLGLLSSFDATYADAEFTLKTPASQSTFRRKLSVARIFSVKDGSFSFTAIFNNQIVSGKYNVGTRQGWFDLD